MSIASTSLSSLLLLAGAAMATSLPLRGEDLLRRVFDAPKEIVLDFNLGDCRIEKSGDGKVYVELTQAYPAGMFTPLFESQGSKLCLRERFVDDHRSGKSRWRIAIPDGVNITFTSQWGSLSIEGVRLDIQGTTGMGNIQLRQVSGTIALTTGTGRVEASRVSGDMTLKSGTGDIKAREIHLIPSGRFESGTGDVDIALPSGEGFEVHLISGTGRARLRLQGRPAEGSFEFLSTDERGRIQCPLPFDREERFTEARGHCTRKTFTRGQGRNRFFWSVGTGKAELKP